MKKFLTVLLVIAVMFTFSFGSAFATVSDSDVVAYDLADVEAAIYAQAAADGVALDAVKNAFLANYAANPVEVLSYTLSKDAVLKVVDTAMAEVKAMINAYAVEVKEAALEASKASGFLGFTKAEKEAFEAAVHAYYAAHFDTVGQIQAVIAGGSAGAMAEQNVYVNGSATGATVDAVVAKDFDFDKALFTEEHAVQKAEVQALINKVVLADFSDEIPADVTTSNTKYYKTAGALHGAILTTGYYSVQDQVAAILAAAQKALDDKDIAATDTTASAIKAKLTADETSFFSTYKSDIDSLDTIKEEGYAASDLADYKAVKLATIETAAAQAKADEKAALQSSIRDLERKDVLTASQKTALANYKETLAALDGQYAAMLEVVTYRLNDAATTGVVDSLVSGWTTDFFKTDAVKTLCEAIVKKVDSLESQAANVKAMTGFDGVAMYDAEAIDDALETAVDDAYYASSVNAANAVSLALPELTDVVKAAMTNVLTSANPIEIEQKFYRSIATWESEANTTYYDEEKLEEVEAAIDAAKAGIRAGKTVDEVKAAFVEGVAAIDAVLTKADRNTAQTKADYAAAVSDYTKKLNAAYASKNALLGGDWSKYLPTDMSGLVAELVGDSTNDDGLYAAYSVAEMAALYEEAAAFIDGLKNAETLTAEAAALNNAIAAIKYPLTLEAKETVLALVEDVNDFKEYVDTIGGTYANYLVKDSTLATYVADLEALELAALNKEIAAIAKDGVVLAEKAAVEALADKVAAYEEAYTVAVGAQSNDADNVTDTASVLATNFVPMEQAAVQNAIAKIDASANPVDAAAVKAAREAYDALGENGIAATYYNKLLALETAVAKDAAEAKFDDVDAKAYIQDMSLKARSVKTAKGNVKVTVVADVDVLVENGYAVEYKFYRSEKSNKGFKVKKTSEEAVYTNTSGVKGTKYFYKAVVVVKDAEGEVVAKTPLKHCLYATRTWTK